MATTDTEATVPVTAPTRRPARQPIPATWQPLPEYVRGFVPAPCSRCCRIAWLPIGPGEALCGTCRFGEDLDRATRHVDPS